MDNNVELEICANCKREIPHYNYVMHTAHCSRNFSLCSTCKEPIPKAEFEKHLNSCKPSKKVNPPTPVVKTKIEQSEYYSKQKIVEETKLLERRSKRLEKLEQYVDTGHTLEKLQPLANVPVQATNGTYKNLIPCQYCELELPKFDLQEHEDYCGSRTDKCEQCGEHVLFRERQSHKDSRHGVLQLLNRYKVPSPQQQQPRIPVFADIENIRSSRRNSNSGSVEKLETSKEIARRLDCKTEYIRNLLHDSASITIPLRTTGTVPRLYRNNSGEGRPPHRRPNPPTELVIPCEFCNIPIPHEDLIQHETGCRPDLAKYNPRRRMSSPTYYEAPEPTSPDVELPCEFCSDLIPASQLLTHQATCT